MKDSQQWNEPTTIADFLVKAHRELVKSAAKEDDSYSLAQPSPLQYVPNITTDHTSQPEDTPR